MWFHIDPSSGTPIYLQIVEQVRRAMAEGVLRPGQRLPATRELAVELAINPNTVVKAYQALERQGLIKLPRGLGAFVAEPVSPGDNPTAALEQLRPVAEQLTLEARRLGCDPDSVLDLIRRLLAAGRPEARGGEPAQPRPSAPQPPRGPAKPFAPQPSPGPAQLPQPQPPGPTGQSRPANNRRKQEGDYD